MEKKVKRVIKAGLFLALLDSWFTLDESTRRYLIHIGKQVPYLPYRYFI